MTPPPGIRPDVHARFLGVLARVEAAERGELTAALGPTDVGPQGWMAWHRRKGKGRKATPTTGGRP